jgi:hypothetical protein
MQRSGNTRRTGKYIFPETRKNGSNARTRPAKSELTSKAGGPLPVPSDDPKRGQFFGELGRVLAAWPEAKEAVGAFLQKTIAANEAQGRVEPGER